MNRELRFGSLVSVVLSFVIAIFTGFRVAETTGNWHSVSPTDQALFFLAGVGSLALLVSSILRAAIGGRRIGTSHGTLMAIAAGTIFSTAVSSLRELKVHPRGGLVEMGAIPVYGGMLVLAILAAGSAIQTFLTLPPKTPNKALEPTPTSVTIRAAARIAPATVVAHL